MYRREVISQALNQIDIAYISEALKNDDSISEENKKFSFEKMGRLAACIGLIFLLTTLSFTTAMAASQTFRESVIAFLFPLFTNDEIIEINEGHRTGSFDETDTLLTFLDKFNTEKMEWGIFAKDNDGFAYTFFYASTSLTEESLLAVVETTVEEYQLLVTLKRIPFEETTGFWQIISYQILKNEEVDKIVENMTIYEASDKMIDNDSGKSSITAEEDCAVIYYATDKGNKQTLQKEESHQLMNRLSSYSLSENVSIMEPTDMVIKFENLMYLISEKGEVIVDDGANRMQLTLSIEDFQYIKSIFRYL